MKINIVSNLNLNKLNNSFCSSNKRYSNIPKNHKSEDMFKLEEKCATNNISTSNTPLKNLTKNQADHKNNPDEHEKDRYIGSKIEQARNDIKETENKIKQTTNEEEKNELKHQLEKLQREKEILVNELTTRHLKFALAAAHHYSFLPTDFESLVSSASIGIYKAAEKFAPSKTPNIHFITYAKYWVKQQIIRDVSKDKQVRIPIQTLGLANKISKAQIELEALLDRKPTQKEIATHLNISEEKVKNTLLNNQWHKEEIRKKIRKYLETNKN